MSKRVRLNSKTRSNSKSMTPTPARLTLFGDPPLLEGEDAAAYAELLARIREAVKPIDVLEEMFIVDVASLEWEVLRWRRVKLSLIRARALEGLRNFLTGHLDYDHYSEQFVEDLTLVLRNNLPEDEADNAQKLAYSCARNDANAVDEVNKVLAGWGGDFLSVGGFGPTLNEVKAGALAKKATEIVRHYVLRKPSAVTLIDELLANARRSMDALVARELENLEHLEYIERVDRLTANAESRRNACLREIERRRVALGETLRRSVQQVEDAEFKVIETPPAKEKNAA
jgi:hypothetical protein